MGLYADPERGRYPIWQSMDHDSFLPRSGILVVTVTVCLTITRQISSHAIDTGRFLQAN